MNDHENDWAKAAALKTPKEIHLFVTQWNWDNFPDPLFLVIRNPECDKGTALCVYWLSDPVSFFELYESTEDAAESGEWSLKYYELLCEIQVRLMSGFYTRETIAVDPENICAGEFHSGKLKTNIPDVMRRASHGM